MRLRLPSNTFRRSMPDALIPLDKPSDILTEAVRLKVASSAMKDYYCTDPCTLDHRPSIHYSISGFNRRLYWSWAIMSDFRINGDSFEWHTNINDRDLSRIDPCLIDKGLVRVSLCEVSFSAHDFIKENQFRYCTPYGDMESVHKYFPNWAMSYDSVLSGSIDYLEDTESVMVPVSKRANPETNFGLKLKDSMPMFAYRANDNPICFAEAILTSIETALRSILKTKDNHFDLSEDCFDFWVEQNTNELTTSDKMRILQMAFKATSASLVKSGDMPPLFYELATPEYHQFIVSGRISDGDFKGILQSEEAYSSRGPAIYSYGEYYFKSIGLDYSTEIASRIPDGIDKLFKSTINELAGHKQIRRVSRKIRCMDQSIENRLSIAKTFIQSTFQRCKILEINISRSSFSKEAIECWMGLHGEALAQMILEYQQNSDSHFFHIDHIVPLAALPDDYISDINSPAWHPANLAIIAEHENIAKNSLFQGRNVRRKNLDLEIQKKAVAALLARYLKHV